jgi:hypothetical protein
MASPTKRCSSGQRSVSERAVKGIQKIIYVGFAAVAILAASMPVFSIAAPASIAASVIRR